MLGTALLLLLVTPGQGGRVSPTPDVSTSKHPIQTTNTSNIVQNKTQTDIINSAAIKHARRRLGRIVGGSDAHAKDFPHQVAWLVNGQFTCGASILSPEWIISAAHCFLSGNDTQGSSFHVGSSHTLQGGSTHNPVAFFQNPGWDGNGMDWDIGLVRVEPAIRFSETTKPIRIVEQQHLLQDGDTLTVTGWGLTSDNGEKNIYGGSWTLQKVNLHFVKHSDCVDHYKQYTVTERMLCAQAPHKDACQGDSGGPLVTNAETDSVRLVGLVSWGSGCASPKYPGVFTDLRNPGIRHFIETVTGLNISKEAGDEATTARTQSKASNGSADGLQQTSSNKSQVFGQSPSQAPGTAAGGVPGLAPGVAAGVTPGAGTQSANRSTQRPGVVTDWLHSLLRSSAASMLDQSLGFLPDGLSLPDIARGDTISVIRSRER